MPKKVSKEDLDLLGELGVDTTAKKQAARTPKEQRIIAGFEEIERFVEENDRAPEHGENRDIFERLYAVRLDQLRASAECREVLKDIDTKNLLEVQNNDEISSLLKEDSTDDEILNALGIIPAQKPHDITELKHVRSEKEKQTADEIAQRTVCQDFGIHKPMFLEMKRNLKSGSWKIIDCKNKAEVKTGEFYIIQGQTAYLAAASELFTDGEGRQDCRLRIIFDNGTESGMLRRSFQKRLWEDPTARRIIPLDNHGELFSDKEDADDQNVGYVYVLRSKSENDFIIENQKIIHKIGITKGSVKKRIANAKQETTYLLAEVEIIETYKVSNLNITKLEKLLHKFFDPARLDVQLKDRFGFDIAPREWFLIPLSVIEEAIQKLIDGTLPDYCYKPEEGKIARI